MYFVSTHNNPPNDLRGIHKGLERVHLEIQIEPEIVASRPPQAFGDKRRNIGALTWRQSTESDPFARGREFRCYTTVWLKDTLHPSPHQILHFLAHIFIRISAMYFTDGGYFHSIMKISKLNWG